jgi:hypothetical protein
MAAILCVGVEEAVQAARSASGTSSWRATGTGGGPYVQASGPIEPNSIEDACDEVGLLGGEKLRERFLANMRDQSALLGDELEFVFGVTVEERFIDLPAVAQIDFEDSREIRDMSEGEHVLGVGGADDRKNDLRLAVGERADGRDLALIVKVRK